MFRYKLRTLLIVLALGPPLIAVAWWWGQRIPPWAIGLAFLAALPAVFVDLLMFAFIYGFGALCHLIGRLPGGHDRRVSVEVVGGGRPLTRDFRKDSRRSERSGGP